MKVSFIFLSDFRHSNRIYLRSFFVKARVEDLQEYVEILKAELEASKKREKARKVKSVF